MPRKKNPNAKEDLKKYGKMMQNGNSQGALLIEQRYGLDGYPPSIVSTALNALAEGKNMGKAIDQALGL